MSNYLYKDCSVLNGTKEAIRFTIMGYIHEKIAFKPIVTLNISMLSQYKKDPALFDWIKESALITPDGISISILNLYYHFRWISRYPGIDMVHDILTQNQGLKVAMIGATSSCLRKACDYFRYTFSQHDLIFSLDGYTDLKQKDLDLLSTSNVDLVLVAMGCPKQDYVLKQLADTLPFGVGIGVGGTFDVWSGDVKRAPKLFRLIGMEWLVRIIVKIRRRVQLL